MIYFSFPNMIWTLQPFSIYFLFYLCPPNVDEYDTGLPRMSVEEQLNCCPRCHKPVIIWSQAINCKTCSSQYHLDCLLQGCLQGCVETTREPNARCQVTYLTTPLGALVATSNELMARNEPRDQAKEPSGGEDTAENPSLSAQSNFTPLRLPCTFPDVDVDSNVTIHPPPLGAVGGANPADVAANTSCSQSGQDPLSVNNSAARNRLA